MLGPHIFGGLPVSSRNSFVNSRQSASCRSFVIFARKPAALTFVGFVLFAAFAISILREFPSAFPERRAQLGDGARPDAVQLQHLALRFSRKLRQSGQPHSLERAPRRRRKTFHECR